MNDPLLYPLIEIGSEVTSKVIVSCPHCYRPHLHSLFEGEDCFAERRATCGKGFYMIIIETKVRND